MSRPRSSRPRRSWRQRLLIVLNVFVALACFAAAAALRVTTTKFSELQTLELGVSLAPKVGDDEVRNILIIGTDSPIGLDASNPIAQQRSRGELLADVQMILRLDPKEKQASVLSIPRDTWLPLAPNGRKGKINAAIAGKDGPANLISTIKENFGISIDNYIEVNFQGFRQLVAALGGVPIYLNVPIRDKATGLKLLDTGCVTLNPDQALAYARSRKLQYLDPKTNTWKSDGTSDFGRISRQQDFMQRAADRAISQGARNPVQAYKLIQAAVQAITKDDSMTAGQMQDLADRFASFNPEDLKKYALPTVGAGLAGVSAQTVSWDSAEPILDVFRGLVYGTKVTPREVIVEVAAVDGAADIAAALEDQLFDVDVATDGTAKRGAKTVIRYGARGREAAGVLARWLNAKVQFVYQPDLRGARLLLEPGTDFQGVRTSALPESEVAVPSLGSATTTTVKGAAGPTSTTIPTTTVGGTGSTVSTTTAPASVTTTTAPRGIVPVDAKAVRSCK